MCANGHSTNNDNNNKIKGKKGGSFHNKFAYKANLGRRANENKLVDGQFLPAISLAARISGVKLERGAGFRRKGCCTWEDGWLV